MRLLLSRGLCAAAALLFAGAIGTPLQAQETVKVTFRVNTATVADTLTDRHVVQIRGALRDGSGGTREGDILPGGKNISWSSNSSLVFSNAGGDYWELTVDMEPEDTLQYKLWTGFDLSTGTFPDGGWEGPFDVDNSIDVDTRTFISGASDTTLALQYYHPNFGGRKVLQYWRPFEIKEDTLAIYFRVNMISATLSGRFNPDVNGPLGVRGDPGISNGALDWGETRFVMSRETNSVSNGSFWSGVLYIPKDSVETNRLQPYKFFINNDTENGWENSLANDRTFRYSASLKSGDGDTTLAWKFFDNQRPVLEQPVEGNVVFRVNVKALEDVGLFDRGVGDRIAVIGAKGWDRPGNYINMDFLPLLNEWTVNEPFVKVPNSETAYKYFVIWDSSRVNASSPNYFPLLDLNDGWEEPGVVGGGNRIFVFEGQPQQFLPGDFNRDNQFFNSLLPEATITNPITVTWSIDMKPAADRATNPERTLFRPGTDQVWIQLDTPLWALTQGRRPGDQGRYEITDPDGDGIYTGTYELQVPTWNQVPFVVTYSTDAGFETNGGGFDRGRRYYQYIRPTSIDETGPTWPSSYDFPTLPWQNADLTVEDPPQLIVVSVDDGITGVPGTFELKQNYPNPFNPETQIRYEVGAKSQVTVRVFNLMGQLVATLVDAEQVNGRYTVTWRGTDDLGRAVASGVYFVKMQAGDFVGIRKMTLLR